MIKHKNEVACIFGFCDKSDFKDLSELKNIQKRGIELKSGSFYPNVDTNREMYYFVFMYKAEKLLRGIYDNTGFDWDFFNKTVKNINGTNYTVYISDRKIMAKEGFKLAFSFTNEPVERLADAMLTHPEFGKAVCGIMSAVVNSSGQE